MLRAPAYRGALLDPRLTVRLSSRLIQGQQITKAPTTKPKVSQTIRGIPAPIG
jgi:hypothetical protein